MCIYAYLSFLGLSFCPKTIRYMLEIPNSQQLAEGLKMVFKCAICSKEENSLLKVNNVKLGIIKICEDCWSEEYNKGNLLSLEGGCDCCR